jgi:hypothetical protein
MLIMGWVLYFSGYRKRKSTSCEMCGRDSRTKGDESTTQSCLENEECSAKKIGN